jgi:predicted membrane chloride channel (bestrophin family)
MTIMRLLTIKIRPIIKVSIRISRVSRTVPAICVILPIHTIAQLVVATTTRVVIIASTTVASSVVSFLHDERQY